jgi:dUTP pyrophosphatase
MYQTLQSAGLDLQSQEDHVRLTTGRFATFDTGVYLKDVLPDAARIQLNPHVVLCGMVCPRSGLAAKHGVTVLNAPGIIDLDYPDTIKVILINLGNYPVEIMKGDRIAQLVFTSSYRRAELVKDTERVSGLGSTGT